jgi:Uma2 family endonuclease
MATQVTLTEPESLAPEPLTPEPLVVYLGDLLRKITDSEFFRFCQLNRKLRIERTSNGEIIVMPPAGGDSGRTNFTLAVLLGNWVAEDGTGIGFDSSTGFTLPNGAVRSPDAAWVKRDRWETLLQEQREEFPPLCPDFVAEIRSRTDSLRTLQAKMREYIANGARLGWLIDPIDKKVYVFSPTDEVTCLENPKTVSGDPVLPGFVLELERLWG